MLFDHLSVGCFTLFSFLNNASVNLPCFCLFLNLFETSVDMFSV